jgi:hypothetical protein
MDCYLAIHFFTADIYTGARLQQISHSSFVQIEIVCGLTHLQQQRHDAYVAG